MEDIVIRDEDVRAWKAELAEAERRTAILKRLLDGAAAYSEWQDVVIARSFQHLNEVGETKHEDGN